ncbi:MAG: ABC transporter ATP-binding protein, partial [Candidatus Kariarchaeaceae archaeon]
FSYEKGKKVLRDLNLEFPKKSFTLITGSSGSGKSTLALALCGFIPHAFQGKGIMEGELFIEGEEVRTLNISQISQKVALVQQDAENQIVTLNVTNEIAFGPENLCLPSSEIKERVNWALELTELKDLKDRETTNLSGGEKQRVAIASILAMKPQMIIFDEPTANLDPKATSNLVETINHLRKQLNLTIIVIEHKLGSFLSSADRLWVMDDGKITHQFDPANEFYQASELTKKSFPIRPFWNQNPERLPPLEESTKILIVDSVSHAYEKGIEVLKDVSFSCRKGELVGLLGTNGSGKSTLLLSILGLIDPLSGTILVNDKKPGKTASFAQQAGFIFQNPNHMIFETTVNKEVKLALDHLKPPNIPIDYADVLMEKLAIDQYKENTPFGLSFGEKRRVNFASIMSYKPPILLLDEPFVGQDELNVQRIIKIINERLSAGGTALLVSHDPNLVYRYCHRIIFMDKGKIIVNADIEEGFKELEEKGFKHFLPTWWKEARRND